MTTTAPTPIPRTQNTPVAAGPPARGQRDARPARDQGRVEARDDPLLQDRIRIVTALVQPILYVFVLGTGLSSFTHGQTGNVSLRHVHLPGRARAVGAVHCDVLRGVDRVGPRVRVPARDARRAGRRSAIITGKCLGGATVATIQGAIVLAMAGLVHVPYAPVMLDHALLRDDAARLRGHRVRSRDRGPGQADPIDDGPDAGDPDAAHVPVGRALPVVGLPGWLNALVHINPITYAVHPFRQAVFAHITASPAAGQLNPPLTWWGWHVPIPLQLAVVLVTGLMFLGDRDPGVRPRRLSGSGGLARRRSGVGGRDHDCVNVVDEAVDLAQANDGDAAVHERDEAGLAFE